MSRLRLTSRPIAVLATHLTAASVLILAIGGTARAVDIEWATVGDPGNAADYTGHGAVAYTYQIGKYEVMNAQYAEFLNAVAATDTNELYDTEMGSGFGGITRSGSSGSYTYSAISGRESMPVNWVTFWDSLRFANWLHNGQPTGAQDNSTTEDGAYTITALGIANNTITRNVGAAVFVTSEDEWYKAAYYDAGSASYFDYPAGSDAETTCAAPGATANTANCDDVVADLTDVGGYTGSASPYGTFDQGGNVDEWNEAIENLGSDRGGRGGSFDYPPSRLAADTAWMATPTFARSFGGFRVASPAAAPPIPSLSPAGMALLGGLVFAIAVGGLAVQRRHRAL